jgi:hypothetical protein
MSRSKRKSIPATMVVYPRGSSPLDRTAPHCDFESSNPAKIEGHKRDLRWFRRHKGRRVRIRRRIPGEFAWMEPHLRPLTFVESTLLPDGRTLRRPVSPWEML